MNPIKYSLQKGKKNPGDKKLQLYINLSVIIGFILLVAWISMFERVFVDIKTVLFLLFSTSIIAAFFLFKKYALICGYSEYLKSQYAYNFLIRILTFILIAMPVGNFTVFTFFIINNNVADKHIERITLIPSNVYEGSKKGRNYTAFEITLDGVTKPLKSFDKSADDLRKLTLAMEIREGYFGYKFYDDYRFQPVEKEW